MEPFGLARGIEGSRAVHDTVKEFYARINNPDKAIDLAFKPLSTFEAVKARINPESVLKAKFEAEIKPVASELLALRHEMARAQAAGKERTAMQKLTMDAAERRAEHSREMAAKFKQQAEAWQQEALKLATDPQYAELKRKEIEKLRAEQQKKQQDKGLDRGLKM